MNNYIIGFVALVLIVVAAVFLMTQPSAEVTSGTPTSTSEKSENTAENKPSSPAATPSPKPVSESSSTAAPASTSLVKDFKDGTYTVEGVPVKLSGGSTTIGGAVYRALLPEAVGDLNADYIADVAFIMSKTSDSGTYFFVAAAMKNNNGYRGTNAVLLGTGIQPKAQAVSIGGGEVIANYDERKFGEPLSVAPSVSVSKYFKVSNGTLISLR